MTWPAAGPRTWAASEIVTAAELNAEVRDTANSGAISATVSGLNTLFGGTPQDGARGYIRVGAGTPYDTLALVYSSSDAKWIQTVPNLVVTVAASVASAGTAYALATQGPLMNYKVFKDAGLTLYARVQALANAGASSSMFVAVDWSVGAVAGALTSDTAHPTSEVSTASTTDVILDSGWNALSTVSNSGLISINLLTKRSGANNGNMRAGTAVWARWSS